MMLLILIVSVIAFILLVFRYIQQLLFISQFPNRGLKSLPIIGDALLFFNKAPEDFINIIMGLMEMDPQRRKVAGFSGPRKVVMLFHPETVQSLLGNSLHINKGDEYGPLVPWLGSGLVLNTGLRWKHKRKTYAPVFNSKILENGMEVMNRNGDILCDLLLQDGQGGSIAVDFYPYMCRCALSIIVETAMGKNMDLQRDHGSSYAGALANIMHIVQRRQISPWLWPDWLFALTNTKREQDKFLEILQSFSRKVITARRCMVDAGIFATNNSSNSNNNSSSRSSNSSSSSSNNNSSSNNGDTNSSNDNSNSSSNQKRITFLDMLLTTSVRNEEGNPLTDQELLSEVDSIIFGGHDTIASSLSWTILLLANHPKVQEKILAEQRDIFTAEDQNMDVELDHLELMQYLDCCIKESMRLFPPVSLITRKLKEAMFIDGIKLPKETTVFVGIYAMHRNPLVWERPDEFLPERFLPGNSLNDNSRHPYAYIPFAAGPRNCIGKGLALAEVKTLLSKLLRKLEVLPSDRVGDAKPVIEIVTKPKGGIRAFFKARENAS